MAPPLTTNSSSISSQSTSYSSHLPVILAVSVLFAVLLSVTSCVFLARKRNKKTVMPKAMKSPLNVDVSVDVYTVMSQDQVVDVPYSPAKEALCIAAFPQPLPETRVELPGLSSRLLTRSPQVACIESDLSTMLPEMSPCSPFSFSGALGESSAARSSSWLPIEGLPASDTRASRFSSFTLSARPSSKNVHNLAVSTVPFPRLDPPLESSQLQKPNENLDLSISPPWSHGLPTPPVQAVEELTDVASHNAFETMDVDGLVNDLNSAPPCASARSCSSEYAPLGDGAKTLSDSGYTGTPNVDNLICVSPSLLLRSADDSLHCSEFDDSGYADTSIDINCNTAEMNVCKTSDAESVHFDGYPRAQRSETLYQGQDPVNDLHSECAIPPRCSSDSRNSRISSPHTPDRVSAIVVPPSVKTRLSRASISSGSSMTLTTCYSRRSSRSQTSESPETGSPATVVGRVLQPLFEGLISSNHHRNNAAARHREAEYQVSCNTALTIAQYRFMDVTAFTQKPAEHIVSQISVLPTSPFKGFFASVIKAFPHLFADIQIAVCAYTDACVTNLASQT
ncbi:hypothetical protein NM688_g8964 [Phlebia brevispora]|uniref:Uncharacterized protein n=1 Tax=Phlebia brevispora TaxID=194682 RepID=A0ACC1RM92_9APHY|nr:hypothetical protein NM688_g8964 [Phlebia brevispora]